MKSLLELIELVAALAVLLLCFATHKVPRYYRLSQYGVFVAFLTAFVFHICEVPIPGRYIIAGVAASVVVAAGCVIYFRAKSWQLPDRLEFLTKTAIWLPALLLAITGLLYYLLQYERESKPIKSAPAQSAEPSQSVMDNRKRWQDLKPPARRSDGVPVWLLIGLLSLGLSLPGSAFAQTPFLIKSCCEQALDLQGENYRLQFENKHLAKQVGEKDSLYRECYSAGEAVIADLNSAISALKTEGSAKSATIGTLEGRIVELERLNKEWVPRTKAGAFIRRSGKPVVIGVILQGVVQLIKAFK